MNSDDGSCAAWMSCVKFRDPVEMFKKNSARLSTCFLLNSTYKNSEIDKVQNMERDIKFRSRCIFHHFCIS